MTDPLVTQWVWKKGQTSIQVPISTIVGSEAPLSASADGEYQVGARLYYLATDGAEHETLLKGFIRINILKATYEPLGCSDPVKAWEVSLTGDQACLGEWTSQGRGALCGKCS